MFRAKKNSTVFSFYIFFKLDKLSNIIFGILSAKGVLWLNLGAKGIEKKISMNGYT